MSEPRTEAGRSLLRQWVGHQNEPEVRIVILAIEEQAAHESSAGAALLDVERLAAALDVLADDEYDLMAPEQREERFDAAERLAAEYARLSEGTDR